MTRYRPGDAPPPGTYWSPRYRRVETIAEAGQPLGGPEEARFRPVPRWAAPLLGVGGAIVGGLYVVFLPVVFVGLLAYYAAVGIKRLVTAGSRTLEAKAGDGATSTDPPAAP